jgi:hypothetical protein
MVIYDSAQIYIDSAATLKEKVVRIDAIITALETSALKAAENEDVLSYSLDDGQTKISSNYRSTESVLKSIEAFLRLRNMYINQLNGRVVRLVDGQSLRNRGIC